LEQRMVADHLRLTGYLRTSICAIMPMQAAEPHKTLYFSQK
jgi:hypothetical protein